LTFLFGSLNVAKITLKEVDRQSLRRLQISDDVIRRAGIDRVEEGIRFPYRPFPNGTSEQPTWTYRVRFDDPKADPKYKSEPGRHHLYFPPVDPAWVNNPNAPVIFVEAEKSALMLLSVAEKHQWPLLPVGLGGCWGFSGKRGIKITESGERVEDRGPLPELEIARNRDVFVWLDKNVDTSPMVFSAQRKLLEALRAFGPKEMRIVKFPDCPAQVNGPDDLAVLRDSAAILKTLMSAETVGNVIEAGELQVIVADMPAECLDGTLGEICTTYMKRFPIAYGWTSLLAFASTLIRRDPNHVRSNIYIAQVGPTNTGKTMSQKWAEALLGVSETNLIRTFVGSGEQFAQLTDAAGNVRLFAPDELGNTLKKMNIDRSTLPTFFTRAWDTDSFSLTQPRLGPKKPPLAAFHCHLSSIGGVVLKEFEQLFASSSTYGFYDRTLFAHCPMPAPVCAYAQLPEDCRSICFRELDAPVILPEVWQTVAEWREADPTLEREVEIAIRAATIAAAYDGRKALTPDALGPARALVDYQQKIRRILRPNEGETIEGRITQLLQRELERLEPGEGITRRDLFTRANVYRLGVSTAHRVVNIMTATGEWTESPGKRLDSKLLSLPLTALESTRGKKR
jgi:hypothetical protein